MITSEGICCDAQIGTIGNEKACTRAAKYGILRKLGGEMHYCEKHKSRLKGNPEHFQKAALAEIREITEQEQCAVRELNDRHKMLMEATATANACGDTH